MPAKPTRSQPVAIPTGATPIVVPASNDTTPPKLPAPTPAPASEETAPPKLPALLVELAKLQDGHFILVPNCGEGEILKAILASGVDFGGLSAVELDPRAIAVAREVLAPTWDEDYNLIEGDFLLQRFHAGDFDRAILLNPPVDPELRHLCRALDLLGAGGVLVAVLPSSAQGTRKFREVAHRYDIAIEALPSDSVILVIRK